MSLQGNAIVSIKNIVDDLPSTINWKQTVYEAITNSIQANSTNININFIQDALDMKETKKYIIAIKIEDNGDGFTEDNLEAFREYKTKHKRQLGCKGIGRFLYLKVFENVHIDSLDKTIDFEIDKDITYRDSEKTDSTIVTLSKPKNKFVVDYAKFKEEIKEHFIAYFQLKQEKGVEISISISENNIEKETTSSSDIPKFLNKKFKINTHEFNIYYTLDDIEQQEGYYCAGGRVVKKNSELNSEKKLKIFKNLKIAYLIHSTYLDDNVVPDTRDDFTIYPKRKKSDDLLHSLAWEDIQDEVRNQIKIIANENGMDIDAMAKQSLEKAISLAPFLGYYIKDNEEILDYETLISNAKRELEKDKDFLRVNSEDMDEEYYQKLTKVTHSELAEYMFDREKIIYQLKSLTNDGVLEDKLHNLFMQKNTQDIEQNYKTNNLWLFDDRFMTYNKVFSDKQIKQIFPLLSQNLDKPDILSISSNTYNKEEITDIVIIELKKASDKITPARAEEQLIDYAGYINDANENTKIRIWTYAFLKFDEKTERSLRNKGYNRVLTKSKYPIYYHPFNEVNTIVNFVDYRAVADDAENRHKTFMKILSGETL